MTKNTRRNKRKALFSSPPSSSSSESKQSDSSNLDPCFGMSRPQMRSTKYEYDPNYPESRPRRNLRSTSTEINISESSCSTSSWVVGATGTAASNAREARPARKANVRGGEITESILQRPRGKDKRNYYLTGSSSNVSSKSIPKRTILNWLIDSGVIKKNAKVIYKNVGGGQLIQGMITGDGIFCFCCNTVITISKFQLHAGDEMYRPYDRIFIVETGLSLSSCQIEAWNKRGLPGLQGFHLIEPSEDVPDEYDDACIICADGGNLICCDNCPSTYHVSCLRLEAEPNDEWRCPDCVCQFCHTDAFDIPVFTCSQCDGKYHWECFREREGLEIDLNLDGPTTSRSFCSNICTQIFEKLERLIGVTNELEEGLTWTLLRRMDPDSGVYLEDPYERAVCNSKIAIARAVMEESFEPVIDRRTQIDVAQSVIYNCRSNFPRISFGGFYTAILERDNEVVSVASLRLHRNTLAEMPFIATRESYRRQGLCHKLLVAIESSLYYLEMQYLVIPSIEMRVRRWIGSYGFQAIESEVMREIVKFKSLMFHSAIRLQKPLFVQDTAANEEGNGADADMENCNNVLPLQSLPSADRKTNQPEDDDQAQK